MKKKVIAAIVVAVAVAVAAGLGTWFLRDSPNGYRGTVVSINIGTVPAAVAALIYIAEDRGFFTANGLRVNIKDYPTGIATTDALLKGDAEMSWVAEFPFVRRAFAKEKISIIAVVGRFNEQILFSPKDRGIHTGRDLKGKKIGLPINTIAEFYLGRFLELHGMSIRDVFLVDVPPPQALDAVRGGRVDGVIAWQPNSSLIKLQMADSVDALPVQSGQPGYGLVTVRNDWIKGNHAAIGRFLNSLARAEDHVIHHPADAKAVLRKRLNHEDAFTETIWSENRFALSLDQSLVTAMEDEARWMIRNGLTTEKQIPDFIDYIHVEGLKAVKPESVNIIGR